MTILLAHELDLAGRLSSSSAIISQINSMHFRRGLSVVFEANLHDLGHLDNL